MRKPSSYENRINALLGRTKTEPLSQIQLEAAGVMLYGHFALRHNQHSRRYLKFRRSFFESETGKSVVNGFVEQLVREIPVAGTQLVVGPESGGAILADKVATDLDYFKITATSGTVFKNPGSDIPFRIDQGLHRQLAGKKVLVVDDVWNTGISVAGYVLPMLRGAGARIVGVAVLANRGNASMSPFCPFFEYWRISDEDCYSALDCPMCKSNDPEVSRMTQL